MTHHSRELLIRLLGLAGLLLGLLAAVILWFGRAVPYDDAGSLFRPAERIAQIGTLSAAIGQAQGVVLGARLEGSPVPAVAAGHGTNEIESPASVCDARALSVLRIRLMQALTLDESQAQRLLEELYRLATPVHRCSDWAGNVLTATRLHIGARVSDGSEPAVTAEEFLTEQVSWSHLSPCVYFRQAEGRGLLMGNALSCQAGEHLLNERPESTPPGHQAILRSARRLLQASSPAQRESLSRAPRDLSIDPGMQSIFDRWQACLRNSSECSQMPGPLQTGHLSAVVLDVRTGGVLAVLCWSGPCDRPPYQSLGSLGALLMEAPPASTVKLLHALAFANSGRVDELMLTRQIKTSGQTDTSVTKRNEWWEKQAICEGEMGRRCDHPDRLHAVAGALRWGIDCQRQGAACGRVSLVQGVDGQLVPGFVGRMRPSISPARQTAMIPWGEYDEIRQGSKRSTGKEDYYNTALAVQSVIGAGDTRISPLGLAQMAAQLARAAEGEALQPPHLFGDGSEQPGGKTSQRWPAPAARTVLQGMRKVMQPAEAGWQGPGTAAAAFQQEFGRPCIGECGLWGKTGTVSRQDPRFAGATLFAGIVDLDQLQSWRAAPPAEGSANSRRRLAFGVIAFPGKQTPMGHLASVYAMKLAAELAQSGQKL